MEKIRIIKLPVKFINLTEEELEQNKSLYGNDWEPEAFDGFKYFNLDAIVDFNEDTEGNVTLTTTGGISTGVYMKFSEFIKLPYFEFV